MQQILKSSLGASKLLVATLHVYLKTTFMKIMSPIA